MKVDVEAAKNEIRAHAEHCSPYEACGLIYADGNKQEVLCGRNIAKNPRHTFMLHPLDYDYADDRGEILAIYHSHVYESPEPSPADKTLAEKNGLPVIILSWPADQWTIYTPNGWKADLIGRPFIYGVLDCLSLVRDYYKQNLNIEIPEFRYTPDWKLNGEIFRENLPQHGFVKVPELQTHDLILMQMDTQVPSHVAVYTGDGMMLHHPPGHLSGEHPYICDRGYYALCTTGFYRHKSLMLPENEGTPAQLKAWDNAMKNIR